MTKSLINQKHFFSLLFFALLLAMPINSYAQTNTNISNNNGKSRISISNNGKDFKIEYEGDITLSNDDTDIVAISSGGFIEIERSSFGNRRRIVIESDRNGNLIKKYFEGRTEKNFTPEGQKWLAEVLQEIVRTTTIGAESRVNRFYNNGGANAVLAEIKRIESDYVKAAYFKLLLNKSLNNSDLVEVINTAGNEIESDHYLASILTSNQKAFLSSNQTITAYINAAKGLESDHYMTNVLKKVINDKSISDSQMDSLLEIATNINSDHYITQVLTEVMDSRTLNSQNISNIISLSKDIQSDHYKAQVLKKVINDKDLPSNAYKAFLGTLSDIQSDHYITEVINTLLSKKLDNSTSSLNNLLEVVKNSVGSDHYAATIYMKIANQNLSDDQLVSALNSLTHIQSDHSMSQALMAFANKVKNSPERVKSAYRAAAKSIGSDHYYGRAVKAID
ncbi:hypothetical protein [Pontimicrobium aquaticum]|uniref:HEAT repeat-containing protein n=1 Tax=Pontimicrobium aquaticum TaxID=2565367 RepID=A0A4U0EP15_9FLAO|nr:hypothetical protein [Pontimicrobium aquaticum]TJY33363.1 hypothetical protein E5167_12740 [Pontimicrobium aquaticum]